MNEQTVAKKKSEGPPRGAGAGKSMRRYTVAEKLKAVRLRLQEGFSSEEVCAELGVGSSSLAVWISRYRRLQGNAYPVQFSHGERT